MIARSAVSVLVRNKAVKWLKVETLRVAAFGLRQIVLTNAHVVNGCREIDIDKNAKGSIKHYDKNRDLALVTVIGAEGSPVNFRRTSNVIQGESVVAAGYPHSGILATDLNVTQVIISALAGVQESSRFFQIKAAVQPGNSGVPLYDKTGSVIGVV